MAARDGLTVPLVGLHGFSDSPDCLAPFLSALGVESPVTPALLGHDRRRMPAGVPFSDDALVADVARVVSDVVAGRGSPVVLFGHSLGASTATGVAAAVPDLVAGLVLEDPPWQVPLVRDGTAPQDVAAERENPHEPWVRGLQRTDDEGRRAWLRDHHPHWPSDEWLPWSQAKKDVDLRLFDAPQRWLRRRWRTVAADVQCPVLLLVGDPDHDPACEPAVSSELAEWPSWHVDVVAGAGHNVRRDQRARAVEVTEAFVRRC